MDKKEFFSKYEILGMCKNSLKLAKKSTNEIVFVSRNVLNIICSGKAEKIREVYLPKLGSRWIEVNMWTSI